MVANSTKQDRAKGKIIYWTQLEKSHLFSFVNIGLLDIVKNCTFLGLADEVFALIQHNTHLYLMNVVSVRYDFKPYIFSLFAY